MNSTRLEGVREAGCFFRSRRGTFHIEIMSEEGKLEKRPSRGNLRLSRKQKTERVRRERINTSLDELKSLVCSKEEEKQDKMDKADILEATVRFVRTARMKEYNQNPSFRSGYNQCVSEFVQFLITLDNVKPEDKAKLLAGMSSVLCGVRKSDENKVDCVTTTIAPAQPQSTNSVPIQHNGKVPIPRLQRQPLQPINRNIPTSSSIPTVLPSASTQAKTTSVSKREQITNTTSSQLSSTTTLTCDKIMPVHKELIESSFENMIDSVFCESGLETQFGKAVSASINLELTDLSSIDSDADEIEEMASLPPMFTFLEDLSNE